jgi:sugar phosphate isomerase/epimerase
MELGISMSVIDHNQHTRAEARELALRLKKQFDLTSIEIVLEGVGRRFAPYPWEYKESDIAELAEFIKSFPVKGAHLPFISLNPIALNERVREDAMEQLRLAIEVAKKLKLGYGVIHASGNTSGMATDREPRRHYHALRRCATVCGDSGMSLSIENAAGFHDIKTCTDSIRSLRDEGLPVSMTFDTGHANLPSNGDDVAYLPYGSVADAIEYCIDLIDNIHLHNNYGEKDQHLGLLDGSIDLKSCIERLHDFNYQGSISLEFGPQVEDIGAEIQTLKEWSGK